MSNVVKKITCKLLRIAQYPMQVEAVFRNFSKISLAIALLLPSSNLVSARPHGIRNSQAILPPVSETRNSQVIDRKPIVDRKPALDFKTAPRKNPSSSFKNQAVKHPAKVQAVGNQVARIARIKRPVQRNKPPLDFSLSQGIVSPAVGGTQILLNGQLFSGAWSQWQSAGKTRIGLSDAALVQLFGANLLSTSSVSQQPIQWFADAPTAVLPTRFIPPFRYLDITHFAQRNDWQIQANGNTLEISTQSAKILAFRQGKQSWGDRIVIELDRSTPWQVDARRGEWLLRLNAQINPAFVKAFKPKPAKRLKSLKLASTPNQTIVSLGNPLLERPQITTLKNPDRIIIDIGENYLDKKDIQWATGLRWRQQYLTLGNARFPVVWLELDPRESGLSLRPILANPTTVTGITSVFQTAQITQAAAAVNGGFFNRKNQLPLGVVRLNNQWLSGPILSRGVVGWSNTGDLKFDRLMLQESIITASGQRLPLTTLNSGYAVAGVARYTPAWGSTYTTLSNGEILIVVQNNQVIEHRVSPMAGGTLPIPANGYLLVVRSNPAQAGFFPVGTPIQLENTITPTDFSHYPNIVGAGPLLVQNGQIVLNPKGEGFSDAFIREKAARSVLAQTADGTILIVTIHHRIGGPGPTLNDTAALIQQMGAINALNLDGGSSTTLYLGGQILDRPPRSTGRVHNGIGVFINPEPSP